MSTSNHAAAAKQIKQALTRKGYKVRARSNSYSMGNSVNVTIVTPDLPPETRKEIEAFCDQYQYGHFDGMADMYEYSNDRKDIPQSKFVFCDFTQSDECKAAIEQYLSGWLTGYEEMADFEKQTCRWQAYTGALGAFWQSWKPAQVSKPAISAKSGYSIEKHTHTRKGFDFYIVVLADRVERDQFETLRDSCKTAGGWYSRQWGQTPGGFAFTEQATAEQWAADNLTDTPPESPKPNKGAADKLRNLAERLTPQIEAKRADRLTNTPKRQKEAQSARIEGDRLERTQQALVALADLHDAGDVPAILANVSTKAAVYDLMRSKVEHTSYYNLYDSGERAVDTPQAESLWSLIAGKSEEQKAKDALADKIKSLQFANIPGYFPTPAPIVEKMINKADIRPEHTVLEPSAGAGAILDALPDCIPGAYECNHTLREILQAKGWPLLGDDFMQSDDAKWDRVIMNPPFEKGQDIDHIMRAFDLLNEGGRLVAIMSPGPFYRTDSKSKLFREWFAANGGEAEDIETGAFRESGTMVATKLVEIRK